MVQAAHSLLTVCHGTQGCGAHSKYRACVVLQVPQQHLPYTVVSSTVALKPRHCVSARHQACQHSERSSFAVQQKHVTQTKVKYLCKADGPHVPDCLQASDSMLLLACCQCWCVKSIDILCCRRAARLTSTIVQAELVPANLFQTRHMHGTPSRECMCASDSHHKIQTPNSKQVVQPSRHIAQHNGPKILAEIFAAASALFACMLALFQSPLLPCRPVKLVD